LRTRRLLLRRWQEADLRPLAALNADPVVMEHFPSTLSTQESAALIEGSRPASISAAMASGRSRRPEQERPFIGFVGPSPVELDLPFAPAGEVGWRLAHTHWGRGYATEAASTAIAFGFDRLRLEQIVSFTASVDLRSRE
jgi:RimJ/RimL family protein N-acetyltransferase